MPYIVRIIRIAKPYYNLIFFLSVLILIQSLVQQLAPLLIKNIVDLLEIHLTTGVNNLPRLSALVVFMFLAWMLNVILTSISNRLGDFTSSRIGKYLVEVFYRKILSLPQSFFDHELSGKIANQLTRGISSIANFFGAMTNFIFPAIMQSIFTLVILAYYSPFLGLLGFIIFPLYIWISHLSTKQWGKEEVKKNELEDGYKGRLQEVVTNIKLVKSSNAQPVEFSHASKVMGEINVIYDRQSRTYHLYNFLRNILLEIILLVMAIWMFYQTYIGNFSFGVLVLIIQLLNQLRRPLFAMSYILEQIQRAESGSKEYLDILSIEASENIPYIPHEIKPLVIHPSVYFNQVSFKYQDDYVLDNVTFEIPFNETVAIVGHSGAGKTTIVNLLLNLYEPDKGHIELNNVPYHQLTNQEIRSHFSLVFQENELFSTTIAENVAYGLKNVSDRAIIEALKKAYAYDFVKDLPQGIHTNIGERGTRLSGGQKQRIQIARALLHPAPIMILDEATASLDAKSEYMVHQALEVLAKEKTLIIIAHRFSTIQNADRIIVLDHGSISDMDTPQKLADRPGIYSKLLRYQIEGNQKLLSKFDITE